MANGYQSKRTGADVDRLLDKIDEFNPATKVDKVSGKQLSTEDFTTALKQKLQGLENYDDTEINNAIAGLRRDFDTLISGDTSEAIDTFNDIVAFLEGIEESENLDNIIAAIQLQIAGKQDKINDLDTIRAGAAKGATALQEHQDISHLATKNEVTQGLREKVEKIQVGDLNLAFVDGLDNGSLAYALPDSANGDEDDVLLSLYTVKTVNGKSIYGNGNIYIPEYDDTFIDDRVKYLEAAIVSKADKEGDYPEMSVGLAEDLGGRPFFEDAEFVFRASAGEDYSIKDGLATIKEIKGNSVVWNQKVKGFASWKLQGGTIEGNEAVWSAESRTGALNAHSNTFAQHTTHKYLITADVKASSSNVGLGMYYTGYPLVYHSGSGQYERLAVITQGKGDGTDACYLTDTSTSGFGEIRAKNYRCTDLTQMFQAGNEPSTIEEFNARKPIVEDEYAYNEGEVIHMTAEGIKSIGDNAWDEEWELGTYDDNGAEVSYEYQIRSKNYIPMLPNMQYYVAAPCYVVMYEYDAEKNMVGKQERKNSSMTTSANTAYIRFRLEASYGTTYKNDIMISLVHSGWKQDVDAGYQPYWEDNLDLSVIGKYFPQGMKKAGSAHDEIRFNKASGKWEAVRRIGEVDMGSLNWSRYEIGKPIFQAFELQGKAQTPQYNYYPAEMICANYATKKWYDGADNGGVYQSENGIGMEMSGVLYAADSAYTDVASFKAAMSGVMLYYELAEPIITEIAEDIELIYDVADFGTEEAMASVPSTPFRARIMYDFNANDSIRNNSVTIRELKRIIAELTNRINSLESNQQ